MKMIFGECDSCGATNRVLHQTVAYGVETSACNACFGNPLSDDIDDLLDEIDTLKSLPKTVEQQQTRLHNIEIALAEAQGRV